jgi:hypothetical protein
VPRPPLRAGLLLLALALPVARVHAQQPAELFRLAAFGPPPASVLAQLEREHVLLDDHGGAGLNGEHGAVRAFVLFERPRAEVLRLLASTLRQKEYRPELSRIQLIEADDSGDVVEYRVRFMLTTLRYRARHGWDYEKGRVWWSLDPSFPNDMQVLDGLWELRELDPRRSVGRFSTRIDLGPALPAFLQDYATRKKLPESMDHVRRWVDSGGSWKP